jgi:bifunctional DNA-binding transcriptional regulator/antitoxin component of YhaV-PrlF toxin-antitoxin module
MSPTSVAKISHRGQTTIPAELRRRWGLLDGGEVGVIDLGDAALIVPGGLDAARREVLRVVREHYDEGLALIDDADLATQ